MFQHTYNFNRIFVFESQKEEGAWKIADYLQVIDVVSAEFRNINPFKNVARTLTNRQITFSIYSSTADYQHICREVKTST